MKRLRVKWPFELWRCSCCGADVDGQAPSSVLSGLACDACLDRGRRGEPYIPLSVRPAPPARKRDERPIVAVSMALERAALDNGETFTLPELADRIRERKPGERGRAGQLRGELPARLEPAIVVTDHALDLLGYLEHSPAADSIFWQWQVSIRGGGAWRPEANSRRRPRSFLIAKPVRFGYASRHGKRVRAKGRSHWYLLIDPNQFCELPDGWGTLDLIELIQFGTELRSWANDNQLPVYAGASSYGTRLLRDARFGGGWRRKIPAATNERIRPHLAGNHYQLLGSTDQTYPRVHKWDQAGAHHYAALMARFPHADQLDARGWFRRPPPLPGATFTERGPIRVGTDQWHQLLAHAGMFTIALSVPEMAAIDPLQLPQLRRPGRHWQTLTSAEVQHVRQLDGIHMLDIWSAWTSPDDDDRLREYALWAGGQLGHASSQARRWLKPVLLATYGMLAARPSRFRNAWRWSARTDGQIGWSTRHGQLIGRERSGKRDQEPATANVLHRAIIESAVRLRSLDFAQQLRAGGMRPIAVYADAVFAVGANKRFQAPPAPWRYEGIVHDLTFDAPGRYRSREETRLPGTPRGRDALRPAVAR